MKQLVINADDFGFTADVNAGIVEAHRNGVLTSTTLMATGGAFEEAVRLAHETPSLDIGCHLVLVQGESLVTGRKLPDTVAALLPALVRKQLDPYTELKAQIEKIFSAGIKPSHFDTHKHTHLLPTVFRAVTQLAKEYQVRYVRLPLDRTFAFSAAPIYFASHFYRRFTRRYGVLTTDHFLGFRLTGFLTEETFAGALARLRDGTTEFMCHPGYLGAELKSAPTRLKEARVREVEALTSPQIRRLIKEAGIRVSGFDNLTR